MKSIKILLAMGSLILTALTSQAISVADVMVNPANGHTYYLLTPDTWSNSAAYAYTLGGTLTTINDAAENQWISDTFFPYTLTNSATDPGLWIGFYDPTRDTLGGSHATNFVWIDGETITYQNWYLGEPNNTGGEYWTAMRSTSDPLPSTWNDLPNNGGGGAGSVWGVVEVVPEPQAIALMAMGVGIFIKIRRKNS